VILIFGAAATIRYRAIRSQVMWRGLPWGPIAQARRMVKDFFFDTRLY
jgi:hypothetical protein